MHTHPLTHIHHIHHTYMKKNATLWIFVSKDYLCIEKKNDRGLNDDNDNDDDDDEDNEDNMHFIVSVSRMLVPNSCVTALCQQRNVAILPSSIKFNNFVVVVVVLSYFFAFFRTPFYCFPHAGKTNKQIVKKKKIGIISACIYYLLLSFRYGFVLYTIPSAIRLLLHLLSFSTSFLPFFRIVSMVALSTHTCACIFAVFRFCFPFLFYRIGFFFCH